MRSLIALVLVVLAVASFIPPPLPASAGLTFGGAATDTVTVTAAANINQLSTITAGCWIYPTTFTAGRRFFSKSGPAAAFAGWYLDIIDVSGNISWSMNRSTTPMTYTSSSLSLTLNKWAFVAGTFDIGATPSAHIYIGDLLTNAAEPTYSVSTDGTGASVKDDSAVNLQIGNITNGLNLAFQGRIGTCFVANAVLSLTNIRSWQFQPRCITSVVSMWDLGLYNGNGTGSATQRDLCSTNHGTPNTALTLTDHPTVTPYVLIRQRP